MPPSDVEFMHPVRHMGYHGDLRKSPRNPQSSRAVKEKISLGRADQNIKLHDQLKLEKPTSKPFGDLHHEVKQTLGDGPLFPRKSVGNNQKQSVDRKMKDDELVKHMSNLPRYLQRVERGDNVQEKVLNFGVLDWGRLEKWKYNQLPVTHRSVMHSPSTSNDSSPFSTVGSSTLSTISDSGILVNGKHSPSPGAHLASSSKDCNSMDVKPSRANVPALQDKTSMSKCASVGQQKPPIANVSSQRNNSKMKFEKGMKNDMNSKFITVLGTPASNPKSCEVLISPKGKAKVPGGDIQKTERFQDSTSTGQHCPGGDKTIVLLLPKNLSKDRFSGHTHNAEFALPNESKQTVSGRSSFSDGFCINDEVHFSELYSDIPHSCPQLSRTEPSKQSDLNLPKPVDSRVSRTPRDVSRSLPDLGEMHTVRSEQMQAEENKLTTTPTDLMARECFKGSGSKAELPPSARRGNQSPNRWPSVGKGKVSRSFSFKEDSALPQLSSTYVTTKSGPVESDACSDISNRDKPSNGRGRSSPLRRLLDPLLRSKTSHRPTSVESLDGEARTVGKSSDTPLPPSVRPVKRNLNFSDSVPADVNGANDAEQGERHRVSMVQALLQVTVKNGLPWFTFAVDNSSDILAATMMKTNSSEKYDCSWIYTFYSFHKAKKKSGGWMGHGSKSRTGDYVPNIIGQMKVNGSRSTTTGKHGYKGQLTTREFVLFDVEPKKAKQESLNLAPNAELAAMVIKVPTESMKSQTSDRKQSKDNDELLEVSLDQKCSFNSVQNLKSGKLVENQNLSSIVVVLPSGVHGLSATGSPSPLLERWKSGGSCDCGGWDIGCQLKVLSNRSRHTENLDATESCCAQDNFDLFAQGGGSQESTPSLRFGTFNKGVHSVDFNASISSLQAFSICISFLHCKNLAKVSSLFREMTAQEPIAMESERIKLYAQIDGMTPSSCAQYPPTSPVGRV